MTTIGHNGGPAMAMALNIDTLVDLANGIGAIETPEQEAQAAALLDSLRDARKTADEKRIELKRPHDEAAKAVQAAFKPLLDNCDVATNAVKARLTPYREAVAAEQARREQEARDTTQALLEAARAKLDSEDLHEVIDAEAALKTAGKLQSKANAIGKQATGLRTSWEAEVTNWTDAFKHYTVSDRPAFEALIQQLADRDARSPATRRDIAGVTFKQVRKAA